MARPAALQKEKISLHQLATQPVKLAPSVHKRLRHFAAEQSCSLGEAIDKLLTLHEKAQ